jgi:hypothetical protein
VLNRPAFCYSNKKEAKKKRGSDAIATKNARHTVSAESSLAVCWCALPIPRAFAEEENLWECNKLLSIQCHEFGVESNKKICQMNSKSSLNVFKLPLLFYCTIQRLLFFFQCAVSLLLFYSLKFTAVQSAAGDNAGQNKLRMQASCAITCTTAAPGRTCFHLLCAARRSARHLFLS